MSRFPLDSPGPRGRGMPEAVHGLCTGLAPLAGAVAAAVGWVLGDLPAGALAGIAGAVASRAMVRQRPLRPDEAALARQVFAAALPDTRRIVVTDLSGLGGTLFVIPGAAGRILLNLGPRGFDDALALCTPCYDRPGKLLVHELAHAWQIAHGHYWPRLARRVLAGPMAGDAFYRPPQRLAPPWAALNLEQQAAVVDEWFAPGRLGPEGWAGTPGMSRQHPYWPYVRDVIQGAVPGKDMDRP
ncbi:hypothetical protein [Azohydromonas aeria]|uniref:hypothetical protein n=1 Tax=Azohydromonas aeria TaxID=2590212 RepID=UPI0012F7D5CB|nr:hypothetical protein [Azohydromonas aeria]